MMIGYARISTRDQDLALQHDALKKAGCERIYEDTATGMSADRTGLKMILEVMRPGDTVVVWKLDRVGRSVKDLIELTETFEHNGVAFRSITDNIDTGTPAGKFFFHVMAALAEMERGLLVERTRAGIEAAKQRGSKPGRKPLVTSETLELARKMRAAGVPVKETARAIGVSEPTLYRWLRQ